MDFEVEMARISVILPMDCVSRKDGTIIRVWNDVNVLNMDNEITIIYPGILNDIEPPSGVSLGRVKGLQSFLMSGSKIPLLADMYSLFLNPFFVFKYRKHLLASDVILANFSTGYLAASLWARKKPIIYVSHIFEVGLVRKNKSNPAIAGLIHFLEGNAIRKSRATICTSQEDIDHILKEYNVDGGAISLAPIGTPTPSFAMSEAARARFESMKSRMSQFETIVIFHGNFSSNANREAFDTITKVASYAKAQESSCLGFLIVGQCIPKSDPPDNLFIEENVENIWPYLREADIALVPIRIGGGVRIKILEYFSLGIPIISTSEGMEGIIGGKSNLSVIVPNDCEEMLHAILALSNDEERRQNLSRASIEYANNLSHRKIRDFYGALFSRVIGESLSPEGVRAQDESRNE